MIRLARQNDFESITKLYENARIFMANSGNPNQWGRVHPPLSMLKKDVEEKQLYVYENENEIHGVFMFKIGEDPTYHYIEGSWIDSSLYGVIHRVASSGKEKAVLDKIVQYCFEKTHHLRIDTHEDNKVMQNALKRNGFEKCGIIYLDNGDPRIAYEKVR